jgi:hypothetical protein
MDLLGGVGQMESRFGPFGDSVYHDAILVQVCTEHAIGSYIVLGASNELLSDVGEVEARFGPFGDGVILGPRLVHGLHRMYHDQANHFGHT